jgi:Fe-S-cluster-containing hydrogenase component 2
MAFLSLKERMFIPTYDNPGHMDAGRITVDPDICNGCGMCVLICPGSSLQMVGTGKNKKACMGENVVPDCMACNDCLAICKRGAISGSTPYRTKGFFKALHRGEMVPPRNF